MSDERFEWMFVIREVSGGDDPRIDELYDRVEAVVESHSGLSLITTLTSGETAHEAGHLAAAELTGVGFEVERTYPDFVTRADIAERADVTRSAADNWVRGHRQRDFPKPVHLAGGGLWLWSEVSDWLQRNGRDVSDGIGYPSLRDHARIDHELFAGPPAARFVPATVKRAHFGHLDTAWNTTRGILRGSREQADFIGTTLLVGWHYDLHTDSDQPSRRLSDDRLSKNVRVGVG